MTFDIFFTKNKFTESEKDQNNDRKEEKDVASDSQEKDLKQKSCIRQSKSNKQSHHAKPNRAP